MKTLTLTRRLPALAIIVALCTACSTTSPPPTATPPLQPTALPRAASAVQSDAFCPPPPNWYIYVSEPGDSLRTLAERTSSSISELAMANCLQNPRALNRGQIIYLPKQPITP